jgi:tyrosine-specific transport protein
LYIYNLVSGLLLADVAINLHESSECEVPSSFKDFVDTALRSDGAGTLTAGASLVSNGCFLAYGAVAAGPVLADTFPGSGLDPVVGTGAFAAIISLLAATLTNAGLEMIANAVVMVVFSSFAALLVPSISNVSDPVGTFLAPGTNPEGFATAVGSAAPLLLSSLMYQNIVPSIAKLLDFDRPKTTAAIAIGSLVPMGMYIAWCYAALGGGLDGTTASGAGAAAFTAFSASALFVSSLTAVMSLAEEYESLFSVEEDDGDCPLSNRFSVPAVAASVMPPVAVALAFADGGDLTGALHFNGAFIIPFLYGILPIILHRSVRHFQVRDSAISSVSSLPQVLLGAGTVCALANEIIQDVSWIPNLTG